jgi:hypothetical protein
LRTAVNAREEAMKIHCRHLLFLLLATSVVSAQVATGTPPFASLNGGPFDTVNLGNLNVHFSIPIVHKAGRGMPFAYDLGYDNSVWAPAPVGGQQTWQPVFNWGWAAQTAIKVGYLSFLKITQVCDWPPPKHGTYTIWLGYVYHDPWGGRHSFAGTLEEDITNCDNGNTSSLNATATDGSGYTLSATYTTNKITTKSGEVINPPLNLTSGYSGGSSSATDANGNQISVSSTSNSATFTDTLGTTAVTVSGTGPITFQYTGPGAVNYTYSLNYQQYTVATHFGVTGIAEYPATSVPLVDNIALPDGSKYSFAYEQTTGSCTPLTGTYLGNCVTGRIASVTLPSGGMITYGYTGGSALIGSDGSTTNLTRTLSPGGTWTYARANVSGSHWTTTISDPTTPTANQTVIDFQKDTAASQPTQNFYETQQRVYQGSATGTPLSTTITC